MRSATALPPEERRRLIAQRLREHGSVAVAELESQFQISAMTARRDLLALERQGVARRTPRGRGTARPLEPRGLVLPAARVGGGSWPEQRATGCRSR